MTLTVHKTIHKTAHKTVHKTAHKSVHKTVQETIIRIGYKISYNEDICNIIYCLIINNTNKYNSDFIKFIKKFNYYEDVVSKIDDIEL